MAAKNGMGKGCDKSRTLEKWRREMCYNIVVKDRGGISSQSNNRF